MSEWKEVKLGDIAKVISGYAFKSSDFLKQSGIPVIKIKNIKNGDVDLSEVDFVDRPFLKINPKYHVNKNDILISLTGSHLTQPNSVVGRIALYRQGHTSLLNQRAGKIIPNAQKVDNQFLYAYLSQDTIREVIALRAHGAANQANISPGDVEATDVLLPPLPTQQKIASILSAFDDLIENNLKRIKLLEEIAQRTYEEWFVKFRVNGEQLAIDKETGLPEGWERKRLGELSDFKYGKMPDTKKIASFGYPIYSGYRITGYYPEHSIDEPSIIIVARGVGGTGDVKMSPRKCWLTNLSIEIVPKQGLADKFYLFFKLKNENMRSLDSGAAQSQITITSLNNYYVVVAQFDVQNKFRQFYEPVAAQIELLQKQNIFLKEARDILLPRLMSGEINVEEMELSTLTTN